jgi:hypothetical protein
LRDLDVCASDDLYEEDQGLYNKEKQKNEHKEYCQIFDLAYIAPSDIEYLLEDYLINEVWGVQLLLKPQGGFSANSCPGPMKKNTLIPSIIVNLLRL